MSGGTRCQVETVLKSTIGGDMEARDQKSNLYACEMTPNPCTQGGGAVVDNGPSSGAEVSNIYIVMWPPS